MKRKKKRWEGERKKEEEEEDKEGEGDRRKRKRRGRGEEEFKFPEALSCTSYWNLECIHPWLITIRYTFRKQNPETRKSVMQHLIRHFGHTQTMSVRYSNSPGVALVPQLCWGNSRQRSACGVQAYSQVQIHIYSTARFSTFLRLSLIPGNCPCTLRRLYFQIHT